MCIFIQYYLFHTGVLKVLKVDLMIPDTKPLPFTKKNNNLTVAHFTSCWF